MKKTLAVMAMVAFAAAANAQLYIGGQLGVNVDGGARTDKYGNTETVTKDDRTFSFSIAPNIGYIINDKWEVGGYINFSAGKTTEFDEDAQGNEVKEADKEFGVGFVPYARLKVVDANKFGVMIQGAPYVGVTTSKYVSDNVSVKGDKALGFGFDITPMLTYQLGDNFRLETGLNFLGIGLHNEVEKSGDEKTKHRTTDFGFNFNSHNVLNVGSVTIGAVYIFGGKKASSSAE